MDKKTLDLIGWLATAAGLVIQAASGLIDGKKQEVEIAEAVRKEVTKQLMLPLTKGDEK